MLTCLLCPNTKKVVKEISSQANPKVSRGSGRRKNRQVDAEEVADKKVKEVERWGEDEWVAEPEPGVLITLLPQVDGGNYIKKIRFSENRFDCMEAQKWWSENYCKLIDLYSICPPSPPHQSELDEDQNQSIQVEMPSTFPNSNGHNSPIAIEQDSRATCLKGVKGKVIKWVVEDEPGVYVTIRSLPDNAKEIIRVELSQERFGEVNARAWWEENKARLLDQYL